MLELAILGLLKEQELHGYELKKQLGEDVTWDRFASCGSDLHFLGARKPGRRLVEQHDLRFERQHHRELQRLL